MLQHLATSCTMLPHVSPRCTMLHHLAPCCTMLHHVAPYLTMLHHVAPCYIMLHHIPPCYTMLHQTMPLITFTFLSNWVNLLFNLVHRGQLCSCFSGRKTQDTRKNKDSCFLKTPFIHQRDLSPDLKPFQFKSHKEASISVRRDLSTMS